MDGSQAEPVDGLVAESVDALSPDEALLLARELPHLRKLIEGTLPGVDREVSRRLALGVLNVAQGHPKLLELADGQAADPERLAALVAAGDQAWQETGGLPGGFFDIRHATVQEARRAARTSNDSAGHAADYLYVLSTWTAAAADTLAAGERALFWLLCCLEEPDREQAILDSVWPQLWNRLGLDGKPLDPGKALRAIAARGLVTLHGDLASYAVHPGIAEAGREQAGKPFRDATDNLTAAYWAAVYQYAAGQNGDSGVNTALLVRAGLAATPYLLRQEQWEPAATLLERAFGAEPTRANAAAALPAIQQITARRPERANVEALILRVIDPTAAEAKLRAYLNSTVTDGDYRAMSAAAGQLVDLCRASGRLTEALAFASLKAGYTRHAGLGPWTQLLEEVQRLQVLNAMGQAAIVLAEVRRLRDHLPTLPVTAGPDEAVNPWNVRETMLDAGCYAAQQLSRWEESLSLNAACIASMRDRHAPATEIARARFNDYFPLLSLGRASQVLNLLLDCRKAFQDANDTRMLGSTIGALAHIEDQRGRGDAAISLQRDALRYSYLSADVASIAVGYQNLGVYLRHHARQPAQALACHLTAGLIDALTGANDNGQSASAAAADLRALGTTATPPANLAILCQQVSDIPGTDPHRLLTALAPDPATVEHALKQLITQVQAEATTPPPGE